jgi:hypothetical protein
MQHKNWKFLTIVACAILLTSCRNESSIQSDQQPTSQMVMSVDKHQRLSDSSETIVKIDTLNPKLPNVNVQNSFESAFEELNQMLLSKRAQDLKRAVFLVENTWNSGTLSYEAYCSQISEIVTTLREMVQKKGIASFKTAGNWAAHTYLCRPVDENSNQPYIYDFEDPYGDRDYSKTFVTKLLNTRKGTCHSLPLLYKILTDEFGGEMSHLAVAPNHLYIKHKDESNRWYNLELTNGHFSTDAWIISSSHIKSEAIANRLYMSALNQTESIAICMTDLADAYLNKYGYGHDDTFVLKCLNAALKANPVYIVAITEKANVLSQQVLKECKNRGIPHFKYAKENPDLRIQALELEAIYKQIDDLGYEEMPMDQYSEWVTKMQSNASIHKQTSN